MSRGGKAVASASVALAIGAGVAILSASCGGDDAAPAPPVDAGAGDATLPGFDGGGGGEAGADAGSDAPPLTTPPVGAPIVGLELFGGYTDPRELPPPVSTSGWEDSSFISPDGTTLYFGYARFNFTALTRGELVVDGPDRPGHAGAGFDVYEARITAGGWDVLRSTMNTAGDVSEAAMAVDRAQKNMFFIRFEGSLGDIYATARQPSGAWGAPTKLPSPVNTPCVEDNVHVTPDGKQMFFDSNRTDAAGSACNTPESNRDIWTSTWDGAAWSAPARVTGGPTETAVRWQPFTNTDGSVLMWSGYDAAECPSGSCIYQATREGPAKYGPRSMVARAAPADGSKIGQAFAIGEVSTPEDGKYLYFTFIKVAPPRDAGASDAGPVIEGNVSLGVARRP